MQRFHIMPFYIDVTPSLRIPGVPNKPMAIHGAIRWITSEWNEVEFKRLSKAITSFIATLDGKEVYEVVEHVANFLIGEIPERNFSVTLGSFGIERKIEKKSEEGD